MSEIIEFISQYWWIFVPVALVAGGYIIAFIRQWADRYYWHD